MAVTEPTASVFIKGDLITADLLNSVNNSIIKTYAEGHASWGWVSKNYYFYITRPADSPIVQYYSSRSAGCEHYVKIYRYEDGAWVQKDSSGGSGELKRWYNSAGEGIYRVYLSYHNNTPTTKIYPSKIDCVRGRPLAMITADPTGHTEATAIAINNRSHSIIYTDMLNAGRVYTI